MVAKLVAKILQMLKIFYFVDIFAKIVNIYLL